jgi:hypothetical protein
VPKIDNMKVCVTLYSRPTHSRSYLWLKGKCKDGTSVNLYMLTKVNYLLNFHLMHKVLSGVENFCIWIWLITLKTELL